MMVPKGKASHMMKRYKLEFEVLLDEAADAQLIEKARKLYVDRGGSTELLDDGTSREITPAEFIAGAPAAIIQIAECNPLFDGSGIEYHDVAWTDLGYVSAEPVEEVEEAEIVDLDEYETGVYLYRWPNGEFSIVRGENRNDAALLLDEWAEADPVELVPMNNCMLDFVLNDIGGIELAQLGEETLNFIWETCYPELNRVLARSLATTPDGQYTEASVATIKRAVEYERTRLEQPPSQV
jgi:hypothetical protein